MPYEEVVLKICLNHHFVSLIWVISCLKSLFEGPDIRGIDGRLWAMLRILYSQSEEDLLKHGYTPEQLKNVGSVISIEREVMIIL